MKCAWFEEFGTARDSLTIGEQNSPVPGADEVLVKLVTSGVNPSDVKKRAGSFPNLLDDGFVIPHSDGAGIIERVGDGVTERQVGDRVWVYEAQYARRFGTAAEYVAVPAVRAPLLPTSASYETGACLGIPAMTAHRCVFADGPVDGKTLLVTGGAGRVGHYAIQWAKRAGATVFATASCTEDEVACRRAGADVIVNHRDKNWSINLLGASGGEKVDRVVEVEFGANLEQVLKVIRTGGSICTYSSTAVPEPRLPFLRMMYMDLMIRMVIVYAMPEQAKRQAILDIEKCLLEDSLQHRVAETVPLRRIADAHELVESGRCRGCVVVTI
ncbi:MAG: NADPH:quinone reductase [Gammaproteobacteria bacterium]|nr:NADPH:quinone reductase [Gammaproteobacteria bacterium]